MNVVKVGNVHFYDISSEKTQWRRKVQNVGEAENASQSPSLVPQPHRQKAKVGEAQAS